MEEKNELNDIILNKNSSSAGNKKIILAAATLGVILIVVIMLMNSLSSSGTSNLPQAALPPEPQKEIIAGANEPLFEEVSVVQENSANQQQEGVSLDKIAQKLKEESTQTTPPAAQEKKAAAPAQEPKKAEVKKQAPKDEISTQSAAPKTPVSAAATSATPTQSGHYIQVGSFEKIQPDKKFLDSITNLGYSYKFHEVKVNSKTISKVLVGPFSSQAEARKALIRVRSSVEAGAFLTKI